MRLHSFAIALVATLAVFETACGPTRPPCNPTTCNGCCDTSGTCQFGSTSVACGARGESCRQCALSEACTFGACTSSLGSTGGGFAGGSAGGFAGGSAGGFAGGSAGGFAGGSAGGFAGGSAGGFAGGSAGGFAGGSAGGLAGGSAGGFAGGSAGGFAGGSAGGFAGGSAGGSAIVPGDTCSNSIGMMFSGPNQLSYTGTLTGAADNRSATCGGAGPDLFLTFDVTTTSEVRFSITSLGGTATPVGYLTSSSCGTEFACHTGTSTSPPTLLMPGTYRLVVDSLSSSASGSFTATVTLSAPASLAGDTCATAEALTLSGGSALVSGTTSSYAEDHSSATCNDVGADRYYRLTLPSAVNLTAVVSPSLNGVAGLYLLGPSSTCSSATESRCLAGSTPGNSTTLNATSLQAGTYFLVVKNLSTADGSFTLSVSTTAATVPGDSCSGAVPLSFSAGSATASGTLSGASNDRASSCASSGADVVFSFTATAGQVLTATAMPGASWRPMLTLTSGSSCSAANETTCGVATSSGSSATLTSAPLAAGTYFLWVDSVSGVGTPGSFTLSASLTTAAGNGETCAGPIPLSFFGGTATASGSTSGMTNDNSSACTGSSGPDRVYSFTATAGQTLTASLTPSGWRGHLVLQGPNSSCSNMPEVACQLGSASGSVVSLTASNLAAGTYFLWVDGVSGSAGSFSLTAALSSGPPATGDTCSDPLPLNFSGFGLATASGSTATAFNDTTASCGGSGPDRVYVFSVVGTRTLSAGVTGSTGFRPVVYVRSSCASTADLSCMAASATGGTASISTTLGTGTYYLWVDGFSSTSGSYTLSATLN